MKEKIKTALPFLLLLLGLGLAGLCILLFAELGDELMEGELRIFDQLITGLFTAMEKPAFDAVMVVITELGAVWTLVFLSVVIICGLWFRTKDKWGIFFFIIAVGGGGLLTLLLKETYERRRPSGNAEVDADGFSFPSGHSLGSFVFYGFLIYLIVRSGQKMVPKAIAVFLLLLLLALIGASRVYLGVHYPSDVIAGYLAGAIWLILCIVALEWTRRQRNGKHD